MTDCLHRNVRLTWAVYCLDDPRKAGDIVQSVHLRANCMECGMPFRFLGDMPLAGSTTLDAMLSKGGAWVSGDASEMGVMISPFMAGVELEVMAVQGRA